MIRDRAAKTKVDDRDVQLLAGALTIVEQAKQDAAAKQAAKQERRDRGSVLHRCRRQIAPHLVAGAMLGTAWLTEGLGWATGAAGAVDMLTLGLGAATAAMVARWAFKRWQRHSAWLTVCAAVSQGWLSLAVLDDVTWGKVALLAAAEYLVAARWWRRVRIPDPDNAPVMPSRAANPAPAPAGDVPGMWDENIGCSGGPLPGSRLVHNDTKIISSGRVYTVQLHPGRHTVDDALGSIKRIASGLRQPTKNLVIEDHPDIEDPSVILVKVITRSPVTTSEAFFREPRFERGQVQLGPYVDGDGEATWRVVVPKRIVNGMITGGTGSGKSRLFEGIALTCMSTGFLHVVHVDGQNGASCPTLWHAVKNKAGPGEIDEMLHRIVGWGKARQGVLEETVASGFKPTPAYPGILIFADEFHALCNRGNVDLWSAIARELNKVGIALITGDQDGSLTTYINDVLRASLQAGNNLGLRTDSRSAGQILAHGKVNLHDLPRIPGFTAVLSPGARHAPFRGRWLPDADDRELGLAGDGPVIPDNVILIEDWFQRTRQVDIDAVTERGGNIAVTLLGNDQPAYTTGPALNVPPVPAAIPPPAAPPSDERLLAALANGTKSPAELASVVGVSTKQVHNLLNKLQEAGKVRKVEKGLYALAPRAVAS